MRRWYLLIVLAVLGFSPGPAGAHAPGDLKLEVAGDGATGVTVRALRPDGQPIETDVRLVLTATGPGGRTIGPIQLNPAGEGRGFYSSGPVLSPGSWTVVVSSPAPDPVRVESVVQARLAQTPPAPSPTVTAAPPRSGSSHRWLWGLAAAAVAAGLAVTAVVRLRRS